MPLQQIFSSNNNNNRGRKGISAGAGTNQVDKVYTQDEKDPTGERTPSLLKRCGSLTSTCSNMAEICRICHSEADIDAPLISPCHCTGSLRFVHQKCLQRWIKSSSAKTCELCRYEFQMESKTKPFNKWEKLDMSAVERRKILCSVTFHVIAITCVIWSLYVLIDRTTEEIARGELEWPFWTKLIVVAIGFTGGVVFMYVQCKMYVQLCRRWKTYNRVIFIQTCQMDGSSSGPVVHIETAPSEAFHTPNASPDASFPLMGTFPRDPEDTSSSQKPVSVTVSMESPNTASATTSTPMAV